MEEKPIKEEECVEYFSPNRGQKIVTALLSVALCALLTYAFLEHRSVEQLAASRDELSAALNHEQGQIQTLTQKLLAAESAPVPTPAPQPSLTSQREEQGSIAEPSKVQSHPRRHSAVVRAHGAEEPWRKQIQSQLSEQQKLIAEDQREIQQTKDSVEKTRADLESNLQSTRDDLSGSIAKNHDELVALEKKGERNFYEFDLAKSKQFQREGPMSISLRKSNTKHKYCDLVMIVNDSEISKKHVNLYEPVLFYPEGYSQPLEVVINSIGKDAAHGYVSEPRYKPSELAARASASGGTEPKSAGQAARNSSTEGPSLERRPETKQ
jgi:hypothetical protein